MPQKVASMVYQLATLYIPCHVPLLLIGALGPLGPLSPSYSQYSIHKTIFTTSKTILLSSPRAKRAGWPKASTLASLARLLLDFIHPPPPLAQLGTTLKVVRASFGAKRTHLRGTHTRVLHCTRGM